jgi:hypothetical protein
VQLSGLHQPCQELTILCVRGAVLDESLSSKAFARTVANSVSICTVSLVLQALGSMMSEEGAFLQLDDTFCVAYANRIVLITKGSYLL